ncbi:hypothetical protein A1OO_17510 [Enterovibrio norvegicus FF-33]|uniref:DUF4114 domain-containing protein n=1 Tax=Enterovibrio norvegicus TaxID=188144 RepID=UPI0002DDE01F|nr:DUF4114 domain-containing protein [Enterovibrio norvegicus]OEE67543.1 hypothetical protein A1OO_17510 [Enterovibrio norvegicus FF-33]
MANIIGTGGVDQLNGTLDDDYIEGRAGDDVIYGDVGSSSGNGSTGAVFILGDDFSAASGDFYYFSNFPPTLNFTGSTTTATFNDDDAQLNGDDACNEYSDDKSQTVEIGGQEYGVNVDFGLKYCDASGNIYTFAVVDVDTNGSGNHWGETGESGKMLIQVDGPEITGSTQLSLVPNSYHNISSLDYSSITEPEPVDPTVGGDDVITAGDGDDTVYGQGGDDYIEGDNGQDSLYGGEGDDVIYGNTASPNFNADPCVNVFQMGNDFTKPSGGEFHTFCFPDKLAFDGSSTKVTFQDDDGKLNGDNYCNEYSDDKTQTVTIDGNTYSVNLDYTLKYCDTEGNVYKFAIIDVDLDGNGHHYSNLNENGNLLLQLEGPEITASTQLSLVPNSYCNINEIDYSSISEETTQISNDEDFIDGGAGNDTIYGQWGDDEIHGGTGDDVIYGGQIGRQTLDLDRGADGYWDVSNGDAVTLDLSNITSSASYSNSVGYYVLDENGNVLAAYVMADNAKLDSAAQAVIDVEGAAKIGLFIIPDGDTKGFNEGEITLSFASGSPVFGQGGLTAGGYVSETGKNGDRLDHEINSGENSCWEDLWCLGDKDFNDVVMKVNATQVVEESDADTIYGEEGNDTIYGGDDNDHIMGGVGDDVLFGQKGDDIIEGGEGNDRIFGGVGKDELYGGAGDDYLDGGPGSDVKIDGGTGVDEYRGSAGDDVFIFGEDDFVGLSVTNSAGRVVNKSMYNADNGFDQMLVNGDANVDFTGVSYQSDSSITGNVMAQIEAVIGDEGDQVITINPNEIWSQSDAPFGEDLGTPDDWDGFIAHLGAGDDSFNLNGTPWSYDASGTVNAPISAEMISILGLSNAQVGELNAYVFTHDNLDRTITVWTDAEDVTLNGVDIF